MKKENGYRVISSHKVLAQQLRYAKKNDMLSFEDITNLIKNIDSREKLLQIKNMIEHDKIRYITKEEKVCY